MTAFADAPAPDAGSLVVCIDDDPMLAPLFHAAASRAGLRLVFVESPDRFKRAVQEGAPAGVVIDQVMPESSGAELVLWLKGLPNPPRVLLIGGDELYLNSAAALVPRTGLALAGSLRKPFGLQELANALATLVGTSAA